MQFANRISAGRALAKKLHEYADRSDVIVLALPRGGVPVAYEVARLSMRRSMCFWYASSEYRDTKN